MVEQPTCEQIWDGIDEEFTEVDSHSDPSWRHGSYMTDVYKRESDNTFWQVSYCRSGDGETNEFREGYATICQVEPKIEMNTVYKYIFESVHSYPRYGDSEITIKKAEYYDLLADSRLLRILESFGLESWEFYDKARTLMKIRLKNELPHSD